MSSKVNITVNQEDEDGVMATIPGLLIFVEYGMQTVLLAMEYQDLRELRDTIIEFLGANQ